MPQLKNHMNIDIKTMGQDERRAFWITNLKAADKLMRSLAPDRVNLDQWRRQCGAIACFGGWLSADAHFQCLGVTANPVFGYPQLPGENDWVEHFEVAAVLFGDESLFWARDWREDEFEADPGATDHQVVVHRIARRMFRLGAES